MANVTIINMTIANDTVTKSISIIADIIIMNMTISKIIIIINTITNVTITKISNIIINVIAIFTTLIIQTHSIA